MATGGGWALSVIECSLRRFISTQRPRPITTSDAASGCPGNDDADDDEAADASIFPYLEAVLTDDAGDGDDDDAVLELMRAYVPGLAATPDVALLGWLGDCRRELADAAAAEAAAEAAVAEAARSRRDSRRGLSESSLFSELSAAAASSSGGEAEATTVEAASAAEAAAESPEALERLRALFPDACAVGLRCRLARCGGDLQAAVEVCLEAAGPPPPTCPKPPCACLEAESLAAGPIAGAAADSDAVKSYIVGRFEHYGQPDERKTHRPEARFDEKPRLTRYLDGRVVAQNGARYVEIKDERAEEIRKATTVCLKPARKYRFH